MPLGSALLVNVDNQVNLADTSAASAIDSVAGAVSGAIAAAATQSDQVAQAASQSVIDAIGGQTSQISFGINTAFKSLVGLISGIETGVSGALGDIGTTIGNQLNASLNPIAQVITTLTHIIVGAVGQLPAQIAIAVGTIIPEIVKAVENPIGALKDVLISIESDIGANLKSLTQIPGAIADASTSLDGALHRTLTDYETFQESQTGWGGEASAHSDLSAIWKAIAGITSKFSGQASPKLADYILPICESTTFEDLRNQPWLPPDHPLWALEVPQYVILKGLASIATWIFSLLPVVAKAKTAASQQIDFDCPQDLLPNSVLVDAVQRKLISLEQAETEAKHDNLSPDRFAVLRDLAIHQIIPAELLEALYREAITPAEFLDALQKQGWTASQAQILQNISGELLTVSEALELFRRQLIDQPTLDAILKVHRYDDAQRKAMIQLAFRPTHLNEAVEFQASADALFQFGLQTDPSVTKAPEFAQIAGAAEGLDSDTVDRRWVSHWNTGSFSNWVSLFFRGLISPETLSAAAGREFIPQGLISTLLEGQRPLLQFRTIETMLRLKVITETEARQQLALHGYSPQTIDFMVRYAYRPAATRAPQNAAALHSTSLGIAKTEYIEGSIDRSQYAAILSQHGYTLDGVNVEIETTDLHEAMLRRREHLQLIVDEYGAGLIDEKAALAQLAAGGFTTDELARAAHKIRAFRARNAKQPTESELHSMLKAGVISQDQYVAGLISDGYSKTWAQNFLAWRASSPAAMSSAPTATPAPAGG